MRKKFVQLIGVCSSIFVCSHMHADQSQVIPPGEILTFRGQQQCLGLNQSKCIKLRPDYEVAKVDGGYAQRGCRLATGAQLRFISYNAEFADAEVMGNRRNTCGLRAGSVVRMTRPQAYFSRSDRPANVGNPNAYNEQPRYEVKRAPQQTADPGGLLPAEVQREVLQQLRIRP